MDFLTAFNLKNASKWLQLLLFFSKRLNVFVLWILDRLRFTRKVCVCVKCSRSASAYLYHAGSRLTSPDGAVDCMYNGLLFQIVQISVLMSEFLSFSRMGSFSTINCAHTWPLYVQEKVKGKGQMKTLTDWTLRVSNRAMFSDFKTDIYFKQTQNRHCKVNFKICDSEILMVSALSFY